MRKNACWTPLVLLVACQGSAATSRAAPASLVTIGAAHPASRRETSRGASAAHRDADDAGGEAGRLYREGTAAAEHGDFPAAAQRFGQAYELAPSLEMAFNAFRMCERAALIDDAARWHQRALTHSPPAEMRVELDAGMASLRDFAQRHREDIARLPDGDATALRESRAFNRGVSHYRRRRFRAALGAFEAARREMQRAGRETPELYFNLAVTHERLGHRAAAVAAFQEYLSRRPDSPDRPSVEARVQTLSR